MKKKKDPKVTYLEGTIIINDRSYDDDATCWIVVGNLEGAGAHLLFHDDGKILSWTNDDPRTVSKKCRIMDPKK